MNRIMDLTFVQLSTLVAPHADACDRHADIYRQDSSTKTNLLSNVQNAEVSDTTEDD